ncbi:MAG: hypothetical protein GX813_01075 [Erysipelotrichia bacterium]|nr:hypothetical protein [Erysipelotrichia bacterium]
MHVCSNIDKTFSYALTFSSQILTLVDSLNANYRPENEILSFASLAGQNIEEATITCGSEYTCKICAENCSVIGNNLVLNSNSTLNIEFPFPVNNLFFVADPSSALPKIDINFSTYKYGLESQYEIEASNGQYNCASDYAYAVAMNINSTEGSASLAFSSLVFSIDWAFIPSLTYGPSYPETSITNFNGNCVAYAVIKLDQSLTNSILPKRDDNGILNRTTDLYPGKVIAGLKKVLLEENIEMKEIGKYDICDFSSYKIAIVCDPYRYYHVIRQNLNVKWSHYIIGVGEMNRYSETEYILDPNESIFLNVSSNVSGAETHFDATSFVGYFSVRSIANE